MTEKAKDENELTRGESQPSSGDGDLPQRATGPTGEALSVRLRRYAGELLTIGANASALRVDLHTAADALENLLYQRDKWLAAFNKSEQFQDGPTKRAEALEQRVIALTLKSENAKTAIQALPCYWRTNEYGDDRPRVVLLSDVLAALDATKAP
jgi:hypothetical protein